MHRSQSAMPTNCSGKRLSEGDVSTAGVRTREGEPGRRSAPTDEEALEKEE